jgi:hypothetical protein
VRDSPPLKMKTAQTVITAGLLKPDRASCGLTSRLRASSTRTSSATTSTRSFSLTKSTTAIARIASTSPIWNVICANRRFGRLYALGDGRAAQAPIGYSGARRK